MALTYGNILFLDIFIIAVLSQFVLHILTHKYTLLGILQELFLLASSMKFGGICITLPITISLTLLIV